MIPLVTEEEMGIVCGEALHLVPDEENIKKIKLEEIDLRLKGCSERTAKTYNFYISKFEEWNNNQDSQFQFKSIDYRIRQYLASKMQEKLSNGSLHLIKAALTSKYGNLDIKIPAIEKKFPEILTREEVKDLINRTDNKKHKLMIKMLYSTGIRLSEIINLKYSDIDFNENIIWIKSGKGKKDRYVGLSTELKKYFLENYNVGSGNYYIFSVNGKKMSERGIQYAITKAVENAGINKNIHVHTLRHTFATHLLESNVDIRKIQHLLGHKNLNTTQIYTHVSKEEIKKIKNPLDTLF